MNQLNVTLQTSIKALAERGWPHRRIALCAARPVGRPAGRCAPQGSFRQNNPPQDSPAGLK
jgi:hypothetical protein